METKNFVADPSGLLTVSEAATYLRRSRAWVYQNIDRLPHVRIGRRRGVLFDSDDLRAWLNERRNNPVQILGKGGGNAR